MMAVYICGSPLFGFNSAAFAQEEEDDETDFGWFWDDPAPNTYFVRVSGSDANSGMSNGDAFRTIWKAARVVSAGDVVYVGAGTYTTSIELSDVDSLSSLSLRFIADVNGTQTGDSGDVIVGAGTSWRVVNCNNTALKDFTFQGPTDRCFTWRRSTGGVVQDCVFDGGSNGVKVRSGDVVFDACEIRNFTNDGIQVFGTAELSLDNCTIEDCGQTTESNSRPNRR